MSTDNSPVKVAVKDVDKNLLTNRCDALLKKLKEKFPDIKIKMTKDISKALFQILDSDYNVSYTPFKVIVSSGHNKPFDAGDVVCITSNKTGNELSRNDVRFNVLREDPTQYEKLLAHIFNERVEIKFSTLYQQGWRAKEIEIEELEKKKQKKKDNAAAAEQPLVSVEEMDELRANLEAMHTYATAVYNTVITNPPPSVTGDTRAPNGVEAPAPGPSGKGKGPGWILGAVFGGGKNKK
jgi:hypothetical protein